MKSSTTDNHIQNVKNRLSNAFRCALIDMPTLKELSESFNVAMYDYSAWEILPEWAKESLCIYRKNLNERIHHDHVIQLYVLENGEKVITRGAWDSFSEEIRQNLRNGGDIPLKTFWMMVEETCTKNGVITRVSTPTDKVFFESSSSS